MNNILSYKKTFFYGNFPDICFYFQELSKYIYNLESLFYIIRSINHTNQISKDKKIMIIRLLYEYKNDLINDHEKIKHINYSDIVEQIFSSHDFNITTDNIILNKLMSSFINEKNNIDVIVNSNISNPTNLLSFVYTLNSTNYHFDVHYKIFYFTNNNNKHLLFVFNLVNNNDFDIETYKKKMCFDINYASLDLILDKNNKIIDKDFIVNYDDSNIINFYSLIFILLKHSQILVDTFIKNSQINELNLHYNILNIIEATITDINCDFAKKNK